MNIFIAAHYLRSDNKISRKDWNDGTYLTVNDMNQIILVQTNGSHSININKGKTIHCFSDMKFEWEPELEDLLAEDYYIYDHKTI